MTDAYIIPKQLKNLIPRTSKFIALEQTDEEIIEQCRDIKGTIYAANTRVVPQAKKYTAPHVHSAIAKYISKNVSASNLTDDAIKFDSFDRRDQFIKNHDGKYYIDTSLVGKGKTHHSSQIDPSAFGCNRVIFLQKQKYDIKVAGLKNFEPFPARHRGLVLDLCKRTFENKPVLRNVRFDEEFDQEFPPNCVNPQLPCQLCDRKRSCAKGEDMDGFNALYEMQLVIGSTRIIAHPGSLPTIKPNDSDLIIIDEVSDLIELVQTTQTDSDFFARVRYYFQLGLALPFDEDIVDDEDVYFMMECCRNYLERTPDFDVKYFVHHYSVAPKDYGYAVRVCKMIQVFGNPNSRYNPEAKTLTYLDTDVFNHLEAAKKVIMLDATFDSMTWGQLGIDVTKVMVTTEGDQLCNGNVTINFEEDYPQITNYSSDQEVQKVDQLRFKYREAGVICLKRMALDGDLTYGNGSRGSNEFQNKKSILLLSLYRKNLGAARIEFNCIYAPLTWETATMCFEEYYKSTFQSDLVQALGRLRFSRRLEEKLTATIVGKKYQCDFLSSLGFKLAGTKKQIVIEDEEELPIIVVKNKREKATKMKMI